MPKSSLVSHSRFLPAPWPRALLRNALALLLMLGASALSAGCDEDPEAPVQVTDGNYVLEIEHDPFRLRLLDADGTVRTEIAPGGLGVAKVAAWDPTQNYDPTLLYYDPIEGPHEPEGLTWVTVQRVLRELTPAPGDAAGARALEVRLSDGRDAVLHVTPQDLGAFGLKLEVEDANRDEADAPNTLWTWMELAAPAGENYYGLGQVFHSLAHRGRTIAMQMFVMENEGASNEAHIRIPLLVSTGAWGVFCDSKRPGFFDVAETDPERIRVVFYDGALRWYLMAAPEPLAIPEQYVSLTAQPAIPPKWAFAPIQWRNVVSGQAMVLQDASDIRENDVPTGAIWIDRPYQSGYNTMEFDPDRYPDPAAMVDSLHRRGFRLAGWNTPYLDETDPDFPQAEQEGWFPEGTFVFQNFGKLLDLTHPDAMAFWQGRVAAARDRGIEGWKLDYAEDVQVGLGDVRLQFSFHDGSDERTMNRDYATFFHRAYAEPLGLPEVFTLVRAGTIGGQRYASVVWPGDLDSDYKEFGDTDEEATHVGGLPSAVRAGTGLSVSGYPFFASDTGGYRHHRPTHEVMVRWTEYAALLPIMQYGGGGENHNPWDFTDYGESHFSPETLSLFKRYARLHIRLFPYFYTLARRAHETGRPTVRPFGLAYPADGRHPEGVFLSGPDLLVAPLWKGGTTRTVPLPAGAWIDWWTGEAHEGPADLDVDAPLGTLPLYLRAGAIVPMLRPTVMTLSPVQAPHDHIDSYDTDPGRLWGRLVPAGGATTERTLHDDTILSLTGAAAGSADPVAELRYTPGSEYAGLRVQLWVPAAAVGSVERDGNALTAASDLAALDTCDACYFRESGSPWLWIALAPDQATSQTTFVVE